ncbi:MAG: hypothetical protein MUD12_15110 [Spirochaetes bacterium]|jgi:hypothetical protein|nr:hypothetical protein [Spirochaetota bacterium]
MNKKITAIRMAAYKTLHLVFVKHITLDRYMIVESENDGGTPVLADYLSFHQHEALIRVKDVGSNVIYLLSPEQFRKSLIDTMMKQDPLIEEKLRLWFPFLWNEETGDDSGRYDSILRQLNELSEIYENSGKEK